MRQTARKNKREILAIVDWLRTFAVRREQNLEETRQVLRERLRNREQRVLEWEEKLEERIQLLHDRARRAKEELVHAQERLRKLDQEEEEWNSRRYEKLKELAALLESQESLGEIGRMPDVSVPSLVEEFMLDELQKD